MNRKILVGIISIVVLVILCSIPSLRSAYAFGTCGDSEKELITFLEEFQMTKVNEILKVKEQGRVKAVIYDREDIGLCVATFDRKLLGLRWKYDSMNTLRENGVQSHGGWHRVGDNGSRCAITIFGDNRDGSVASYVMTDYTEIARDNLESDYIIDIYILDGIEKLPRALQQRTPDKTIFVPEY